MPLSVKPPVNGSKTENLQTMQNQRSPNMATNGSNPSPNTVQIGEIEKTLLWAFALTGLKKENYPDPIQLDVLIDFIATNYPTHSTGEIRHAFNLAVAGKLEIDANHYQSFSAAYVARILSGYVPVRVRGQKSLQSNANGLKIDSQNMATPNEKENTRKNYISECLIKPWKFFVDRKSTSLNSSHLKLSRMPSSA